MKISSKQLRSIIKECLTENAFDDAYKKHEQSTDECPYWEIVGGSADPCGQCKTCREHGVGELDEKAPPGFEGTVKAMKKDKNIENPYALAWSMRNKGYKSHKKS